MSMLEPITTEPGMMQSGMMYPGMMYPGMMQPGMMQPGMMQPGFGNQFFNPFCLFGPLFSPFCNLFMNPFVPPPPPFCSGFYYTVQPGDSLFTIARRFGVRLNSLIAANPQVLPPNYVIFPGQIICIPLAIVPPPPATCTGFYYTVRPGDTLFLIAQRFGVTLSALIAANPQITNPNIIFPGQIICVPRSVGFPPPPATCTGFYYRVQAGDTLFLIAQRFGVSLNALIAANPQIPGPNYVIFPGQVICIPRA